MTMPIIVVDGWLIFPDGFSRAMTREEKRLWRLGQLKTMKVERRPSEWWELV